MTAPKRCSTCGTVAATCICMGCQSLFCSAHFNDHHQHMAVQLEHLMGNCDQLAMRTKDTIQTQRTGSSLLSQIDEWQKITIDKVFQVADNARQQALQLMRRKKTEIIQAVESVGKEILTRQRVGDYVEYDLERLKKVINKLQQDLDQFVRYPIELHINKNQHIDWNNLIYVEHRYSGNLTRHFQEPVSGRSQSSTTTKDRSALSKKENCLRLGGCDGCTYVPFSGGWNDGGYYRRGNGGGYCHCTCHRQEVNDKRPIDKIVRR